VILAEFSDSFAQRLFSTLSSRYNYALIMLDTT
jgi:hypothetical protein